MKKVSVEKSRVDMGETTSTRFGTRVSRSRERKSEFNVKEYLKPRVQPEKSNPTTLKDLSAEERAKIGLLIQNLTETKIENENLKSELENARIETRNQKKEFDLKLEKLISNFKQLELLNLAANEQIKSLKTEKAQLISKVDYIFEQKNKITAEKETLQSQIDKLSKKEFNEDKIQQIFQNLMITNNDSGCIILNKDGKKQRKLIEVKEGQTLHLIEQNSLKSHVHSNQKIDEKHQNFEESFDFIEEKKPKMIEKENILKNREEKSNFQLTFNKKIKSSVEKSPLKQTSEVKTRQTNPRTLELLLKQKEIIDQKRKEKGSTDKNKVIVSEAKKKSLIVDDDDESSDSDYNFAVNAYKSIGKRKSVEKSKNPAKSEVSKVKKPDIEKSNINEDGYLIRFNRFFE